MAHQDEFIWAGQTVTLRSGAEFRAEDWADRVFGRSWMMMNGNPCALKYAVRAGCENLPIDNEVVYGKVGAFAELVHVSEIDGYEQGVTVLEGIVK